MSGEPTLADRLTELADYEQANTPTRHAPNHVEATLREAIDRIAELEARIVQWENAAIEGLVEPLGSPMSDEPTLAEWSIKRLTKLAAMMRAGVNVSYEDIVIRLDEAATRIAELEAELDQLRSNQ